MYVQVMTGAPYTPYSLIAMNLEVGKEVAEYRIINNDGASAKLLSLVYDETVGKEYAYAFVYMENPYNSHEMKLYGGRLDF